MNNDQEGEFESVEQLVKVQTRPIQHRYQSKHQGQHDQWEEDGKRRWDFLQANPVLPPGKHHLREEPRLRLKYPGRDKSTRATLDSTSLDFNTKHKSFLVGKARSKSKIQLQDEIQQQGEASEELRLMLEQKVLVYRRINNNNLNKLGKDKEQVLCSVFFDCKKEKGKSMQQPVLEYLSKTVKIRPVKTQSHWLSFSSAFQSGNLLMAFNNPNQLYPTYQLYMQNDINTKGCTQWYYFSATNKARGKVKFRIMNFYKPTSLYQKGMKVLYSYDRAQWKRTGTSIRYMKDEGRPSYVLEFIYEFDVVGKTTYFSYGYPYTFYGNMNSYIECLFGEPKWVKYVQKSNLCLTAMGNPVPLLTITNHSVKRDQKQLIYIIGRQHPGQTPASFIVQGIIHFLVSGSLEARDLRDKYEFRVIPMVNIDGVISGNYRSNLSGSDVNRVWQFPSKRIHPQIYYLKQEIYNNRKQTVFFLDVHAHSRKMNSFFYGSKSAQKEGKLYPFVCSKLNKFVSYFQSSFTDDPSKKTTARVVLEHQCQIARSLTFEVSFYGWVDQNKGNVTSFKQGELRGIGETLGMGFYYSMVGVEKAKLAQEGKIVFKTVSDKEKTLMKNSVKMLEKWTKQMQKQTAQQQDQVFSEGSSLDPQHFQLKEDEKQFIAEITKVQSDKLAKNHLQPIEERNFSTPKKDDEKYSKTQRMMIYSTLSPNQPIDSKLLSGRGEAKNGLGISSNQFYHISSGKAKKKPFSVKQLQLQLQCANQTSPQRKLRGVKLKMQQPLAQYTRYESVDNSSGERIKNYKQDVLQMKRALKYLLQSKSADYDQYKTCFKTYTNQHMNSTLGRPDRRYNK